MPLPPFLPNAFVHGAILQVDEAGTRDDLRNHTKNQAFFWETHFLGEFKLSCYGKQAIYHDD